MAVNHHNSYTDDLIRICDDLSCIREHWTNDTQIYRVEILRMHSVNPQDSDPTYVRIDFVDTYFDTFFRSFDIACAWVEANILNHGNFGLVTTHPEPDELECRMYTKNLYGPRSDSDPMAHTKENRKRSPDDYINADLANADTANISKLPSCPGCGALLIRDNAYFYCYDCNTSFELCEVYNL